MVKYCPSCEYTEDEEAPGLINLHHVYDKNDLIAVNRGARKEAATHHTAEEHIYAQSDTQHGDRGLAPAGTDRGEPASAAR